MDKKILLISLLLLTLCSCSKKEETDAIVDEPQVEIVNTYEEEKAKVEHYENINSDFYGLLTVGNLIEDEIIVNSLDNVDYERKDFYTGEYSIYGTTWLDYRNEDDDQNLIIYGHYVYPDYREEGILALTNLHELKNKETCLENNSVSLLTDTGIRYYEVSYVFYVDENQIATYPYVVTNYTEELFNTYITNIKGIEFFDLDNPIAYNDKFLTLQTCVENQPDLRLIVVCKEVRRIEF